MEKSATLFRPKLIVAGASAYARLYDYDRIRKVRSVKCELILNCKYMCLWGCSTVIMERAFKLLKSMCVTGLWQAESYSVGRYGTHQWVSCSWCHPITLWLCRCCDHHNTQISSWSSRCHDILQKRGERG